MFTNAVIKDIVKKVIINNFGITNKIIDRHIIINNTNVIVKIKINFKMNIFEIAKILQNQLYIELCEKTDDKTFNINIILSE